ncbi:TetR/AcrR family transcriptional regulator [Jonesia quinghaiensis]|uniref:TetR/AcrR family transcriptional regulator n=1 Tax=Jonesia quinghaiensis TaxID=262806 RepID=UPI00041F5AB0|nr:TetR/AcrR family transcriptional regulator [Jonesia quinghaiensis]
MAQYARGKAKKDEIVREAMAVFAKHGYYEASLRDISARVGISHPGLLHHFPSKGHLLQAVLDARDAEDTAILMPMLESGHDYIDAVVKLVEHNMERPGMVSLFSKLSAEATDPQHPAHEYFARRYEKVLEGYTLYFMELNRQGLLSPSVDPTEAAKTFVALLDGLQVLWLYSWRSGDPDRRVDMPQIVRRFLTTLQVIPETI